MSQLDSPPVKTWCFSPGKREKDLQSEAREGARRRRQQPAGGAEPGGSDPREAEAVNKKAATAPPGAPRSPLFFW